SACPSAAQGIPRTAPGSKRRIDSPSLSHNEKNRRAKLRTGTGPGLLAGPSRSSTPFAGSLPAQPRADEPLSVALGELHVGGHAPVRVELPLRAEAAVEVAFVFVAVLVAGPRVAFDRRGQRATHAGFDAVTVEVEASAGVELLVGDARDHVRVARDLLVVADAHAPLVEVDRRVLQVLVGEIAEQVEVRG